MPAYFIFLSLRIKDTDVKPVAYFSNSYSWRPCVIRKPSGKRIYRVESSWTRLPRCTTRCGPWLASTLKKQSKQTVAILSSFGFTIFPGVFRLPNSSEILITLVKKKDCFSLSFARYCLGSSIFSFRLQLTALVRQFSEEKDSLHKSHLEGS